MFPVRQGDAGFVVVFAGTFVGVAFPFVVFVGDLVTVPFTFVTFTMSFAGVVFTLIIFVGVVFAGEEDPLVVDPISEVQAEQSRQAVSKRQMSTHADERLLMGAALAYDSKNISK
jgi:hypothetical protein